MFSRHYLIIILIFSLIGVGFIYFSYGEATRAIANSVAAVEFGLATPDEKKIRPVARTVKGIYLTAYTAGNAEKLDALLELIDKTELNAVVIDIKDYSGWVLYDSAAPLVNDLRTKSVRIRDLESLTKKLRERNIYSIARQTVFQDPILAKNKPEWAIKNKTGGVWRDNLGLAWVDPTQKKVWDYNIGIAKEAAALGFDEINFDYVRFPSDGNMSEVKYASSTNKNAAMKEFFHYLSEQMKDELVWISLDMFGFVMERHNGMNIGQKLADAVDSADYISPMMYPSHYPKNHLGFANSAEHPAEVIANGARLGMPYFIGHRAKFRPWIQAFNLGAKYDAEKIRAQIDAVEKYTDAGWLMWNAANRYTAAGLNEE